MPGKKIDFDVVRAIGRTLSNVEESTMHGAPALKLKRQLLTCPAIHRSAEPDTLAVRINFDQRAELIAEQPDIYYLTDHYENYPVVLVRLSRISRDALTDLLSMGWRFVNSKAKGSKRARAPRTSLK